MSRAFVKETAEGAAPPERMVSSGPNLVTEEGLAKIAAEVERLEMALAAETNVLLRETLERDLRYWRQSLATAQVVKPSGEDGAIAFGSTVTFVRRTPSRALGDARNGTKPETIRLVGEDEANPKLGL